MQSIKEPLQDAIRAELKPYIVKRPKGMCQVLFSLTVLDKICDGVAKRLKEKRP